MDFGSSSSSSSTNRNFEDVRYSLLTPSGMSQDEIDKKKGGAIYEISESISAPSDVEAAPKRTLSKKLKWASYFSIFCAGFALFSDGYQNSLMTMTNVIFTKKYPTEYTSTIKTRVSNALIVGEVIGQVIVGLTCDYLGRKVAIITTTLLIVIGGILATASHGTTTDGMFWMLTISRGIVGFGTGGEYPASSTAATEAANEAVLKYRGPVFVMVTNFPLAIGGPISIVVFLIIAAAAGVDHLSTIWRTLFGIGCIWPLTVFYFRLRMVTSELYKQGAIQRRVPYLLIIKYYWRRLIGTCLTWFLYDFVTFPNGVFSASIISSAIDDQSDIVKVGEWQLLLSSIQIPGVFIGAYLCHKIGRKNTMITGFVGYIVIGLIIGLAYKQLLKIFPLFVVFYGLLGTVGNLGPGDMMGLVSSESYATPVRGTCYGLSAAIGKVGAVVGTQAFTPIQNNLGKQWTFIIAAICGLAGVLCCLVFLPNLTADDLVKEDKEFFAYLHANGWHGLYGLDEPPQEAQEEDLEVDDPVMEVVR